MASTTRRDEIPNFLRNQFLGGGNSNIFWIFTPIPGGMMQFDEHIFQMGWFNHHLDAETKMSHEKVMHEIYIEIFA